MKFLKKLFSFIDSILYDPNPGRSESHAKTRYENGN